MIHPSRIAIIGAHTINGAFGKGNGMPWPRGSLRKDMLERFKPITSTAPQGMKNLLIAGSTTAVSMGNKPLPNRYMMSISRTVDAVTVQDNGMIVAPTVDEGLAHAETLPDLHHIFFIGGAHFWEQGLKYASHAYITIVDREVFGEGVEILSTPLPKLAATAGFYLIGQERVTDTWDGQVGLTFLDYFKDRV